MWLTRFLMRRKTGLKPDRKNYNYTAWSTSTDILIDYLHRKKLEDGWEKCTDIEVLFGKAFCIYRKRKYEKT